MAALSARARRYFERTRKDVSADETEQSPSKDDIELFAQAITEDAPGILQHLAHWRRLLGVQGLRSLVGMYIESSDMVIRKRVLQLFMEVYGLPDDDRELEARMTAAVEKLSQKSFLGGDEDVLVEEIRRRSPIQLSTWQLLTDAIRASRAKSKNLKGALAKIREPALSPGPDSFESEMCRLAESIHALRKKMKETLPSDGKTKNKGKEGQKEKSYRRSKLQQSLAELDNWSTTSPAFAEQRMVRLPEGIMARAFAGSLWTSVSQLLKESGGTTARPGWLSNVDKVDSDVKAKRFQLSNTTVGLAIAAALFLALGLWLVFRPSAVTP
jgi:hypothetical protein